MSKRIICITGTDTAVGKTTVSELLVRGLKAAGEKVAVFKPVETGNIVPADAKRLWEAAGREQEFDSICPYSFLPAVSPHIAAKKVGVSVSLTELRHLIFELAENNSYVIVEGAGGLLVPFNEKNETFADLVSMVNGELIVVVGSKLGCINHSSLTFEVILDRGINCLGYVFNDLGVSEKDESKKTNRESVKQVAKLRNLSELAYVPLLLSEKDKVETSLELVKLG